MDDAGRLDQLEEVVSGACSEQGDSRAGIAAGVYAGVDFAIAHPEIIESLHPDLEGGKRNMTRYESGIARFTGLLRSHAPMDDQRPGTTDMALVGGVVGLIGDHLRLGRTDRLEELRPDLVLFVLLPYIGFAEAKKWADQVDSKN
jgi:hypothetical protein